MEKNAVPNLDNKFSNMNNAVVQFKFILYFEVKQVICHSFPLLHPLEF